MNRENHTSFTRLGWLALFASTSTLVCCALPIVLVALGFGAVVAALSSRFPLLVTLSENSGWMFGISAGLLGLTALFIWGRQTQCPTEPGLAARCKQTSVISRRIFWISILFWLIGFSARYFLLPLRNWIGL